MAEIANQKKRSQDEVVVDVVRSEFSDDVLQTIISVVLTTIDKYILTPTYPAINPDESRMLEKEVERTSLIPMSKMIKLQLDEQVGPTFHVVYGRNFALHVTHERQNFAHICVDGADVVVWKHGE